MSIAEQGGNQPQKVLLIGGPKHGERISLPSGQNEWEFVSMDVYRLMTPPKGGTSTRALGTSHMYRHDSQLSDVIGKRENGLRLSIFTHEVLAQPQHGAFNVIAHSDAIRTIEAQKDKAQESLDDLRRLRDKFNASEEECEVWQRKYEDLLALNRSQTERFAAIRNVMEQLAFPMAMAVKLTGQTYESSFDAPDS